MMMAKMMVMHEEGRSEHLDVDTQPPALPQDKEHKEHRYVARYGEVARQRVQMTNNFTNMFLQEILKDQNFNSMLQSETFCLT